MIEEEEFKCCQVEFEFWIKLFVEMLDLDEFFVQLLVVEGFINFEEVVYVDIDELLVIDGVDEDIVNELQVCVCDFFDVQNCKVFENVCVLGVEDSLIDFDGLIL